MSDRIEMYEVYKCLNCQEEFKRILSLPIQDFDEMIFKIDQNPKAVRNAKAHKCDHGPTGHIGIGVLIRLEDMK